MKTSFVLLAALHVFINALSAQYQNETEEYTSTEEGLSFFQKSRCIFPNGADHVTRAVLLQQCLSEDYAQGNETNCYEELGCFNMSSPWVGLLRPFPTPKSPQFIDVHLYLFTRNNNSGYDIPLWPAVNLEDSDFNPKRNKTVFITHGFASSSKGDWVAKMKDAYLTKADANVILVDWSKGANTANYLQVASNTRIVGAELARFLQNVTSKYALDPENVHLIGHSLGAHISAYCAKKIHNIGRLTALDPAQPGFEGSPAKVRLAQGDAKFIEVLHTSARPFLPTLGFGMMTSVGDVDFYMNGGLLQPGCSLPDVSKVAQIKSIEDLAKIPVEVLSEWVACSHGRANEYYISALFGNCTFWGRLSGVVRQTLSSGTLGVFEPVVSSLTSCSPDTCIPLSLETPSFKARGIFSATTKSEAPYCNYDPKNEKKILDQVLGNSVNKYKNIVSGVKDTVSKVSPSRLLG